MVGFSFLLLTFHSSGDVKGRLQDWINCLEVTGLGLWAHDLGQLILYLQEEVESSHVKWNDSIYLH